MATHETLIWGNKINGVIHVSLPAGTWLIDGSRLETNCPTDMTLTENVDIRRVHNVQYVAKVFSSTGEEFDNETYQVMLDMAKVAHLANPDDLDAEFHYRKMTKWNIVKEVRQHVSDPCKIVVKHEFAQTDVPKYCTLTVKRLTDVSEESPFSMTFNRYTYFIDLLNEFIAKHELRLDNSHNSIRFWKIAPKTGSYEYAFSDSIENLLKPIVVGKYTYEQELNRVKTYFDSIAKGLIIKYGLGKQMDAEFARSLLSDLTSAKAKVYSIDSKVKTYKIQQEAAAKIQEIINKLERRLTE